MFLVALDVALGVLLLGAIAALACRHRQASDGSLMTGWLLVLIPLPLAVGLHLAGTLSRSVDQALFIAGVAAFAIGAALLLGREDDDWREPGDDSPPWWPEFERALRDYERRPRPMARV